MTYRTEVEFGEKIFIFFQAALLYGTSVQAAALAGIATQFVWGFLEIMVYRAFYEADANAFPMTLSATAAYVWMQQAFLAFLQLG